MEFLRTQNEELNAQFTAAEARSSEKERECAERREKDKRDRVHRGKRHTNPQEDNEIPSRERMRRTGISHVK
jgi:septal ring factor EnvC (AmiA/AmiB activator)